MDKLLQPNFGLMIWTALSFAILLFVLGRFAWKPILQALAAREGQIREDLSRAEKSQKEAESLRLKYESELAEAQRKFQDLMNAARVEGDKMRETLLKSAKEESEKILEKGRKDLVIETDRLRDELRRDVADLSLGITEKILSRAVDKKMADEVVQESLAGMRAGK